VSSNIRPPSRDSQSEYSALSYTDSHLQQQQQQVQHRGGPPAGRPGMSRAASPAPPPQAEELGTPPKSRSRSFFKSPFRRPSRPDNKLDGGPADAVQSSPARPANRNTWGAAAARRAGFESAGASPASTRRSIFGGRGGHDAAASSASPEPALGAAGGAQRYQLNVGNNVFDVAPSSPHRPRSRGAPANNAGAPPAAAAEDDDPTDPLVQALDELNRVTSKATRSRGSADHYFNIPTPVPGTPLSAAAAAQRGTPPPQYEGGGRAGGSAPGSAHQTLGAPPAAHTAREMHAATSRYLNQRRSVFEPNGGGGGAAAPRGGGGGQQQQHARAPSQHRAVSPVPRRSASPNPQMAHGQQHPGRGSSGSINSGAGGFPPRAVSPLPQQAWHAHQQQQQAPMRGGGPVGGSVSRPTSRAGGDMALQLSNGPPAGGGYGSARGRAATGGQQARPVSGVFDGRGFAGAGDARTRSRSVAEGRQFTKDGRAILHHGSFRNIFKECGC
jgi:hypothetical protein